MIYVMLYPQTIVEHILSQIGRPPLFTCDKIRYGGGVVECVMEEMDQCLSLPLSRVSQIFWSEGYKECLASVKSEYLENMKNAMNPQNSQPNGTKPPEMTNFNAYR